MTSMHAMVLNAPRTRLENLCVPRPTPGANQVLIAIEACGVCRTDLHLIDGELANIVYPIIPGHQIVGTVVVSKAPTVAVGERVGVPWLGWTCGQCRYCESGHENLCDTAEFTGYQRDGGYAQYAVADARYCFPLAAHTPAIRLAPLLCAGMIGYRSLCLAGLETGRLGLFGFGAAAHLLAPVAQHLNMDVYAYTRDGDRAAQQFARDVGCTWAGGVADSPGVALDAAIIFAPVGTLVPIALAAVRKGGRVVCGGIHMSDIPTFPYTLLWGERQLLSVANLTRRDGVEYLALADKVGLNPQVQSYPLVAANEALDDLRNGRFSGAAVLQVSAEP